MEERFCQGCQMLRRQLADVTAENQRLRQLLEQERRAGKRQAAPFSKGKRRLQPQKPGRKPGDAYGAKGHRPPPTEIHETCEASLPDVCPDCGGPIDETGVQQQYQVEIPRQPIHRQFNVHVGACRRCQRRIQGRHALQTSDALGAAASQLGPDAQAAIVELNKSAGLAHGKVAQVFRNLFGIQLTRGGVTHVILRAGRRCAGTYQALQAVVKKADWVVPDETGWRLGGVLAWLHGFVSATATVYVIDPQRDAGPATRLLGHDYAGALIHDGWSPYDHFQDALHQQCLQHALRRCDGLLETATRGSVHFPRRIADLLRQGLDLRDRYAAGAVSDHGLAVARSRLQNALEDAVFPPKTDPDNERFAKHLWHYKDDWFAFLHVPELELDATNWRAEHAMRFGVILRKVWGGNRTPNGAQAQEVLMSVWRTCWQRGVTALDWLSRKLRNARHPLPRAP